jgi:hypothetical protein
MTLAAPNLIVTHRAIGVTKLVDRL